MPLTSQQIANLNDAIHGYVFPANGYDFINNISMPFPGMAGLEAYINGDLRSGNVVRVRNGLANVVYWGWAQNPGLQQVRVTKFLNGVTPAQIAGFMDLQGNGYAPNTTQIRALKIPEFSGLAFISKILAFMSPNTHCVLDKQISQLRNLPPIPGRANILDPLAFGANDTQIRVSAGNVAVYNAWCQACVGISTNYLNGYFRCVDVERGFFALIQAGNVNAAREILNNA